MKPPQGYDYLAPVGYKASENPTFPSKLYEAAEEILVVRPTLRPTPSPATTPTDGYIPPSGYDYSPPQGYSPDKNPTFPEKLYTAPQQKPKKKKKKKPDFVSLPAGYDYSPPRGYSAEENPTFPSSLYEEPKPRQPETGYIPAAKPTVGYKPPPGYDYNPPPGKL